MWSGNATAVDPGTARNDPGSWRLQPSTIAEPFEPGALRRAERDDRDGGHDQNRDAVALRADPNSRTADRGWAAFERELPGTPTIFGPWTTAPNGGQRSVQVRR